MSCSKRCSGRWLGVRPSGKHGDKSGGWRARYERLTLREREVFALVVGGLPNKQIADVLGTTERTSKAHRAQLMHKMGAQSAVELGRGSSGSASSFRLHPRLIWRDGGAHEAETLWSGAPPQTSEVCPKGQY